MKTFRKVLAWELRLQRRSPRTWIAVLLYLGVTVALPALYYQTAVRLVPEWTAPSQVHFTPTVGPTSALDVLLRVQPLATFLLVLMLIGRRATAGASRTAWTVLGASPVSSATFVLGRWLSVTGLAMALAVLPLAATAVQVALRSGWELLDPAAWLGAWSLHVGVAAAAGAAFWLGLVTIFGSELLACGVVVVVRLVVAALLNEALFPWRVRLDFRYVDQLVVDFLAGVEKVTMVRKSSWSLGRTLESERPLDLAAEWLEIPWPSVAVAFFLLGLAPLFLRRSLRDVKPVRQSTGPLRTFGLLYGRLRRFLAPSAGLLRGERAVAVLAAVVVVAACAAEIVRQRSFLGMARARYAVETTDPVAPTSPDLEPVTWRIEGAIAEDGAVDLAVRTTFENRGTTPEERMAFALSPDLALEVERHTFERQGNRMELRLAEPLAPGATLTLAFRLRGTPKDVDFKFSEASSFVSQFERHVTTTFAYELDNLAPSLVRPAASARYVSLTASDLTPVPRYSPWELNTEKNVRGDAVRRDVDLEVDLTLPRSWTVVDGCGNVSDGGRLLGDCRVPVREGDVTLTGGRLTTVSAGELQAVVLPAHRPAAEAYLEEMARIVELAKTSWPGIDALPSGLVLIEDLGPKRRGWWGHELLQRTLLVNERELAIGRLPRAEDVASDALWHAFLQQRRFADDEYHLFFAALRYIAAKHFGVSRRENALLEGNETKRQEFARSIFSLSRDADAMFQINDGFSVLYSRLPALLQHLSAHLGPESFKAAVDELLDAPGEGTFDEFAALLREKAAPGDRAEIAAFIEEYVYGDALPQLELAGVLAERRGRNSWEVRGELLNKGTGRASCPLTVRTASGVDEIDLRVAAGGAVPFRVLTDAEPLDVELDPACTCFRFIAVRDRLMVERVELKGKV